MAELQLDIFGEQPPPTFSAPLAQRAKKEGMKRTAVRNKWLPRAREIAVELIRKNGSTHADAVRQQLEAEGMPEKGLGNAAGSIFMTKQFEATGEEHISTRVKGHGNKQEVWRLKTVAEGVG